jgi:ribonuclease HI
MDPDELVAAADAAGMNPLEYSHMIMGDPFLDEESERRVFNPLSLRVNRLSTVKNLTAYNARTERTHTMRMIGKREPEMDMGAIAVSVGAARKNNGTAGAEAAIGVYFGASSPHNFSARVPARLPQTSQIAELFAARQALQRIRDRWHNDFTISTIHIVTDSKYVVGALSEDIEAWRTNGYQNSQGRKVANHLEIKKLDLLMLELVEDGVNTSFWPVERTENEEADRLAKDLLGLLPH